MPRTAGGQFTTEYQINGVQPYDTDYYLNYHRPVFLDTSTTPPDGVRPRARAAAGRDARPRASARRARGSGNNGPRAPGSRPPTSRRTRSSSGRTAQTYGGRQRDERRRAASSPSNQYTSYQFQDGAIPSSTTLMRFGLMTFDQDPSAASASRPARARHGRRPPASRTPTPSSTARSPACGATSPGGTPAPRAPYTGMPANCATPPMYAVGARNPAAPPWEGRMMPFPSTNDLASQQTNNQNVANVILATAAVRRRRRSRACSTDARVLLLERSDRPGEVRPARPLRRAPAVHHRPDRRRAQPGHAAGLPGEPARRRAPRQLPVPEQAGGDRAGALRRRRQLAHRVTTYVIGFAVSSAKEGGVPPSARARHGRSRSARPAARPAGPATRTTAVLRAAEDRARSNGVWNVVTRTRPTRRSSPTPPSDLQKALADILGEHRGKNATTRTAPAYSAGEQNASRRPERADDASDRVPRVVQPVARQPVDGRHPRDRATSAPSGIGRRTTVERRRFDPTHRRRLRREPQLERRQPAHLHRVPAGDVGSTGHGRRRRRRSVRT